MFPEQAEYCFYRPKGRLRCAAEENRRAFTFNISSSVVNIALQSSLMWLMILIIYTY